MPSTAFAQALYALAQDLSSCTSDAIASDSASAATDCAKFASDAETARDQVPASYQVPDSWRADMNGAIAFANNVQAGDYDRAASVYGSSAQAAVQDAQGVINPGS